MKYLKGYDSYKTDRMNEEFIGDMLKAATGAFKSFISNMMAPFKGLKDDFKKGMKLAEVKNKISNALDTMLSKVTTDIEKAKDENEINQMTDSFVKELDEKMIEFDKEIKLVNESKIYEGLAQDALIGGRVLFSMLKDEYNKVKNDFDKKFIEAKDLSAKRKVAIDRLKTVIEGYKKKINDEKLIKSASDKYKADNKIENNSNAELFKSYNITKVEELIGKEVSYKKEEFDDSKKPEEQPDMVAKGEVRKVENGNVVIFNKNINKEIKKSLDDIVANKSSESGAEESIKAELGKIKNDPEAMKKIGTFLPKFIANINNVDKIKAVDDILEPK